jgi:hypothetical protein
MRRAASAAGPPHRSALGATDIAAAYDDDEDEDEDEGNEDEDKGNEDDGGERWEVTVDLRPTKFLNWRPIGGNVYAKRDDRTTAHRQGFRVHSR